MSGSDFPNAGERQGVVEDGGRAGMGLPRRGTLPAVVLSFISLPLWGFFVLISGFKARDLPILSVVTLCAFAPPLFAWALATGSAEVQAADWRFRLVNAGYAVLLVLGLAGIGLLIVLLSGPARFFILLVLLPLAGMAWYGLLLLLQERQENAKGT